MPTGDPDPYRASGLRRNPFAWTADDRDPGPFLNHLAIARPRPGEGRLLQLIGEKGAGKTTHLRHWHESIGGDYHYVPPEGPFDRAPIGPLVFWDEADRLPDRTLVKLFRRAKDQGSTVVAGTHRDLRRPARKTKFPVDTFEFAPVTPELLREWVDTRMHVAQLEDGSPCTVHVDDADLAAVLAEPEGRNLRGAGDLLHVLIARRVRSQLTLLAALLAFLLTACGGATVTDGDAGAAETTNTLLSTTTPSPLELATTLPSSASSSTGAVVDASSTTIPTGVRTGAARLAASGFESLDGMRVGLIANQTSTVDGVHLIDLLDEAPNVELVAIFAPEHGVRGTADAGELVDDEIDARTGAPILSLYGSTRQPTAEMYDNLDVVVFDLQSVGARYYTYISTMGLAMQTAAEVGIPFVVLDRPNPAGGERVSGFTRVDGAESFISQYPVPTLYGLTPGELAQLVVQQEWMPGVGDLELSVVRMEGWQREMTWADTGIDWIPPSPGLPFPVNAAAYPAFVQLEATSVSYGSGTFDVFTMVGAPWIDAEVLTADLAARSLPGVAFEPVSYVPEVIPNVSVRPRNEGELVHGTQLIITDAAAFDPVGIGVHIVEALLLHAPGRIPEDEKVIDRPSAFDRLAGTPVLRQLLEAGVPAADIVASWTDEVETFRQLRTSALLY